MKNKRNVLIVVALLIIVGVILFSEREVVDLVVLENLEMPSTESARKLGNEVVLKGEVVGHVLDDVEIGGYIQVKRLSDNKNVFILYDPYSSGSQLGCINRIDVDVGVGDSLEVMGVLIDEIGGVKPVEIMVSTCESDNFYIKILAEAAS